MVNLLYIDLFCGAGGTSSGINTARLDGEQYAKEGWKNLDTHLGSGSHAIACYQLGFSLLGIELDKQYYDAARKRLIECQKQPMLF